MRDDTAPSLEGILRSYRTDLHGDHYVLELATAVSETGSFTLDGQHVRIPRERVAFIQELK